jgi:hypothetical protein
MRRNFLGFWLYLILLIVSLPLEVRAQGLRVDCITNPILPGCQATYRVTRSPPSGYVLNYAQFRWVQIGPDCNSNWSNYSANVLPANPSFTYIESYVGDFTVEAKITMTNISVNPPVPVTLSVSTNVTVPPPDTIVLPSPGTVTIRTKPSQKISGPVVIEKKASESDLFRNQEILANLKVPEATTWRIIFDHDSCPDNESEIIYQKVTDLIGKNRAVPDDRWKYYSAVNKPPEWVIRDWAGVLSKVESLENGGYRATVMVHPIFTTTPYGNVIGCPWDYLEEYNVGVDGKAVYQRSLDPQGRAGMDPGYILVGG